MKRKPIKKKRKQTSKRFVCRKHLEMVANMQCCFKTLKISNNCQGPTQAHHLLKPWDGIRGMGMKSSDRNVIPLCMFHHGLLHTKYGSEKAFFEAYNLTENIGKVLARNLWEDYQPDDIDSDLPF
jgi:hypothetical protein